jgi:hypothetical protein
MRAYPVGGVLDGRRRVLALLGAEDLLHLRIACRRTELLLGRLGGLTGISVSISNLLNLVASTAGSEVEFG